MAGYPVKILNRSNFKNNQSLRANKTLSQLVLLAIKSSKNSGLYFNQIKTSLKQATNIHCSNYVLKQTLSNLLSSNHLKRKNGAYFITSKKFNRKKQKSKSRKSRKFKKRLRSNAKACRGAMKSTVEDILREKQRVLEKVVLKAFRSLRRRNDRKGFVFNQVKSEAKVFLRGRKVRNVVLINVLEKMRGDGKIRLKKGRNYLVASKKLNGKRRHAKSIVKRAKRVKNKVNRSNKKKIRTPIKDKIKKPAKTGNIAKKSSKNLTKNVTKKVTKRQVKSTKRAKTIKPAEKVKNEPLCLMEKIEREPELDHSNSFLHTSDIEARFSAQPSIQSIQPSATESETLSISLVNSIMEKAKDESKKELYEPTTE